MHPIIEKLAEIVIEYEHVENGVSLEDDSLEYTLILGLLSMTR